MTLMELLNPVGVATARIRAARAEDAAGCGEIMHEAFRAVAAAHGTPPDFPNARVATGLAAASIADPEVFAVVAEAGGQVVGSNFLVERDAIRAVGPISVDPSWQGEGVGRQLMEAVIRRAGPGMPIRLVQGAYNMATISLYAGLGFEVKEPLLMLQGSPHAELPAGTEVRPMDARDLPACDALCAAVHGFARGNELRAALRDLMPMVAVRDGRITAYMTSPCFWIANHGVAETEDDMAALLAGAAEAGPVSLLLPTRQASLLRYCLATGMRAVQPMTLMAMGEWRPPSGPWFPSVFY